MRDKQSISQEWSLKRRRYIRRKTGIHELKGDKDCVYLDKLKGHFIGKVVPVKSLCKLTDVVMPEMNGRDLAKNLLALNPQLKCLFTSGYTANVIVHHGVLDEGVFFIQKPFSRKDLAAKVREVLDQK